MEKEIEVKDLALIENRILVIRNAQVMIDRDLAELYGVETKVLNQAVKRNIERFPERFRFQLSDEEVEKVVTNCDHLYEPVTKCDRFDGLVAKCDQFSGTVEKYNRFESLKHSSVNPYAFTEQGVAMLASVLKSEIAVKVSVQIMDAFVAMRKFLATNAQVFTRLDSIERHQIESDKKIDELFTKMEQYGEEPKQGIFFQGQIFDSYAFVEKLIQKAKKEIVLIDGYVDLSVLERLSKKKKNVKVSIYTGKKTPLTNLDVEKFNEQYPTLELKFTDKIHDRFLLIDNSELYHIGASVKDLGKKCFGFEKMEDAGIHIGNILKNL